MQSLALIVFMKYAKEVKFMGPINLHFFDSICLNWEEPLDPECKENSELIIDGNIKEENAMWL